MMLCHYGIVSLLLMHCQCGAELCLFSCECFYDAYLHPCTFLPCFECLHVFVSHTVLMYRLVFGLMYFMF